MNTRGARHHTEVRAVGALLCLCACAGQHGAKRDAGDAELTLDDASLPNAAEQTEAATSADTGTEVDCSGATQRGAGCPCEHAAQCKHDCLAEVFLPEGERVDCASVRRGSCSAITEPPGCYCVLEEDAGASAWCFEGFQ